MGRTTHTFKIDGDNYDVETVVEGIGLVRIFYGGRYVQRSRGRITAQGFVPDEYFVMRGREDRSERAQFNWTDKRVTFTWRDETRTADLQPGMQDPVSVLHQLYFMQPLEKNAKLSIATSRKLSEYGYEVVGEESIQTPIGAIPTIRVRRTDEETVQFVMWLDPARNMMPMRMYYEDRNRTVLEQTIREYTVEAGPAR